MAQKKILYVINHLDWFWSHRLPLAQGALAQGWRVEVAAHGARRDPALTDYGFHPHELPDQERFGPIVALKTIAAIRRLLRETQADMVHAITLKYAFLTGLAALGNKRTQRVFTIAGLGYLFSGEGLKPKILRAFIAPFLKLALKNARVIVQNPDDLRLLIKGGFVQEEQCALIRGSGVDIERFNPRENAEIDPLMVLMPTRLILEKGVGIFVEAAHILKSKDVHARFVIAGGIDKRNPHALTLAEMRSFIAGGGVEWVGKVDDMPALYAQAALIAYPSYYREGVPKVLLEAAAMGKAIVTTDHPGCREAVRSGVNGLLVPLKDAPALAAAIGELLNDPARRAAMGQAGRRRAVEEFDAQIIVAQTLMAYA